MGSGASRSCLRPLDRLGVTLTRGLGHPYALRIHATPGLAAAAGEEGTGEATLTVPTRSIALGAPATRDPLFVCRVVSRLDGQPLPTAVVSLRGHQRSSSPGKLEPPWIPVDSAGYFETPLASGDRLHAQIRAPGFGPALIWLGQSHSSRSRALEVRLDRAATVDALVLEDGMPVSDVHVVLRTPSHFLVQGGLSPVDPSTAYLVWEATTGADGRCSIEDLAPDTPVEVRYERSGAFARHESQAMVLRAGERRPLVLRVGAGTGISGQLLDRENPAGPFGAVWLKPAEAAVPRYFDQHDSNNVTIAPADSAGHFEFRDVAPGTWWVGPAPDGPFAARAVAVKVGPGTANRELLLEVYRGLHIRGTVLGIDGVGVANVPVRVSAEGEQIWIAEPNGRTGPGCVRPRGENQRPPRRGAGACEG